MITRQRKVNLKTDQRHSNNDDRIKENLPTALLAVPSSNGYFRVGSSHAGKQNNHSKRSKRSIHSKEKYWHFVGRLWILLSVGSLYCFCTSYYTLSSCLLSKQRVRTPVLSSLNKNFTIIFPSRRFTVPSPRKLALRESQSILNADDKHDFGGLDIRFLEFGSFHDHGRVIYHDSYEDTGYEELWEATDDDENVEYYYAFDDDAKRNPLVMYDDPDIHLKKTCRRTNWHRQLPITCNSIHEFNFQGHVGIGDTKYVGRGYFRTVYLTSTPHTTPVVMKMLNWRYDFTYEDFEYMRMDAIVNEKLNGNPEIVPSYAFCGNSIIGEAMALGDMRKIAFPYGLPVPVSRKKPNVDSEDDLVVYNTLSGTQKLELSLQMAEAVLLLHSYPGGVIVHDDIYLSQFLLTEKGKVKLNDFNRAEIMLWNEKDQEYCKYRNEPGGGNWRSPEEYHDNPLDEKIDVWSLGNNMFALLTGIRPFETLSEDKLQKMVMNGNTAFIDPRFKKRSFAESKLVEIIPLCWVYDPRNRIDIFQLVDFLREAVRENKVYKNH